MSDARSSADQESGSRVSLATQTPSRGGSAGIGREPPESEATIEGDLVDGGMVLNTVESGYALGEILGRGGEGEVRAAVQRAFGRTVAVKRVRGDALDAKRLRRFRAEALVTGLLEHPHIVPIYDFRTGDDGELQLVMKQVVGTTWRDLIRPRTPEQIVRAATWTRDDHLDVLLKVTDAVAFAHARGFLHRDLKPENVMVAEHGEVLVLDWGCAISLSVPAPHPAIPTLDELDAVSGTPAFMAPEQARNDRARMGPASDVYLLGGMLYQLLTGRTPHRGSTVREAMIAAGRGEVIPPAERTSKPVDEELAAIAMAALHADPALRTPSAAAFAAALRGYRRHAEALQLLREAKKRLKRSREDTVEAEDAYRKALSACEQALELWPEHQPAQALLLKISFAYAEHAQRHGAYRVARTMANTAADAAEVLDDRAALVASQDLGRRAVRADMESRHRDRTMRRLRTVLNWGGPILTALLAIGFLIAWRESAAAQRHLADAKRNLTDFQEERAQRLERERLAVPALVAQSREAIASRLFAESLASVEAALAFEPGNQEALLLRARVLVVLGRRDEASAELDAYLALVKDDADAIRLRDLCRHGGDDLKTTQAIADLFLRQGASAEAEALFTGVDEREAVWRERLAAGIPRFEQRWFARLPDQTYALDIPRSHAATVTSLDAVHGIPVSRVTVAYADRLRDLTPLSGAPLTVLRLEGCGVRDASAVRGAKLRELSLARTEIADLSPFAGMPLESVDLDYAPVTDLSPLQGAPLRRLSVYACAKISDLGPLRKAQLEYLSLGGPTPALAPKVVSLRPLEGQVIRYLDLRNLRTLTDFTVLERLRPERLLLDGTRIDDLSPLWSLRLTQLGVNGTVVSDLSPVAQQPLERLDAPMTATRGWEDLRRNTSLKLINGLPVGDFWVLRAVGERIARDNPAYSWNLRGVVENGELVELDCSNSQINNVAALRGLTLRKLVAYGNRIGDASPLRGQPLREVNMDGNPLTDVAWLDQSPIEELRISQTRVSDLTPLRRKHLRSLHTAGSAVRDLRPVLGLPIAEITVTPANQTADCLKALRAAKDIQRIGVAGNQIWPAGEFWKRHDAGAFK